MPTFQQKVFPNFSLCRVYIVCERHPLILSNFCKGDWQGGQDMPPVVTDLQVADKDWQVSMLPADSWLGRNMNRKWVSYEACFELSSLTFFPLEHNYELNGSGLFF